MLHARLAARSAAARREAWEQAPTPAPAPSVGSSTTHRTKTSMTSYRYLTTVFMNLYPCLKFKLKLFLSGSHFLFYHNLLEAKAKLKYSQPKKKTLLKNPNKSEYIQHLRESRIIMINSNVLRNSQSSQRRRDLQSAKAQRRPHTAAGRFMATPAPTVGESRSDIVDRQELSAERPFRSESDISEVICLTPLTH